MGDRTTARLVAAATAVVVLAATAGPAAADEPGPTPSAAVSSPAEVSDAATEPATRTHLDVLLDRRRHDGRLGADVAYVVTDARTGEVIAARRPTRLMQPASNMKIITATTAVAALGARHRLRTSVVLLPSTDGRRHVAVVGAGDALLTADGVRALARRTARALGPGKQIVVHPDASLFPTSRLAPGWIPQYLGSSVGYVRSLGMYRDRSRTPGKNVVRLFASALRAHGRSATTGPQRNARNDARVLARAPGHTVGDAVGVMLSESDSSIAEVLFRLVALTTGHPATWAGGRAAAREVLAGLGVDAGHARLLDGSGLSRDDRITPLLVARVLHVTRYEQRRRFAAIYRAGAMPVAGRSGTLRPAFGRYSTSPSSCARGDVQAKTGTILQTIALSGVAKTVFDGQRVFSIIVNHRPSRVDRLSTRRAVDGLAATIVGCWR